MDAPRVTALVPCYNSARFIGRTLDSLAAQTWPNLEILIGEDGSTDDTLAIVTAFAAQRGNVRVLRREHNLGWLRNANDLMANAEGELLFFAFHDDTIAPTYVEKLAAALHQRPGAVLAFSDLQLTELDGSITELRFEDLADCHTPLRRGLVMASSPPGWWIPNRGVFRASAFARTGGIRPNRLGEYSADWTWLLHLSLLGDFVRVPELLCHKVFMPTSLSKSWGFSLSAGRRALREAGVREVWGSHLDPFRRALLAAYIALNLGRVRFLWRRGLNQADRP